MVAPSRGHELIPDLPEQLGPGHRFVDLYTLVPALLDLHEAWGAEEVREFVEEKTREAMDPEDVTTLSALVLRCGTLRQEFGSAAS